MLRDITLGQYMPGKTAVHKLDPRTKIILTILYIAMIFCVSSPIWYVLPFLYVLLAVRLSGLKPRHLLKSIKPLRFLLILDEPTAGLDPAGRRSILNMIRELHAAGGLTVIMVSHSMDDISTLATRLVVMSKGQMVLTGTPREVFMQQELLQSIGLDVPEAAKLTHALRAEGFDLPDDLYTLEEVRQAILRLAGKEGSAC